MQELQGQLRRLRQNNTNIGDFKVKWIHARIDQPRQMDVEVESSRELILKQPLTKRLRIQAERKRPAEIFCLRRKEEYKKGISI
ncbi:hypothetical protein V6N13_072264 [Hibiscus sabdariffa]